MGDVSRADLSRLISGPDAAFRGGVWLEARTLVAHRLRHRSKVNRLEFVRKSLSVDNE